MFTIGNKWKLDLRSWSVISSWRLILLFVWILKLTWTGISGQHKKILTWNYFALLETVSLLEWKLLYKLMFAVLFEVKTFEELVISNKCSVKRVHSIKRLCLEQRSRNEPEISESASILASFSFLNLFSLLRTFFAWTRIWFWHSSTSSVKSKNKLKNGLFTP